MSITKAINILLYVLAGALVGWHILALDRGVAAGGARSEWTLICFAVFVFVYAALGIWLFLLMGRGRR